MGKIHENTTYKNGDLGVVYYCFTHIHEECGKCRPCFVRAFVLQERRLRANRPALRSFSARVQQFAVVPRVSILNGYMDMSENGVYPQL